MYDLRDRHDDQGLAAVLKLSWPASLTMLNSTLIRFVDGLMVSRVGPGAMSAQLLAGMWSFSAESFATGVLTVVNTYVSQNFGAGNLRRTARYAWSGMVLGLAFALLACPLAVFARAIFAQFQPADQAGAPELLGLEVMYFRYMVLGMSLTLTARPLEQFFFGVHRPKIVLMASVAANLWNVGANYVLIFGKCGFPALGLEGAAIGSVTAWALQLAILLAAFLSRTMHEKFSTRFVSTVRWGQIRDLLRLGWSAGLQLFNDIFCWSVFLALLVQKLFGESHLAASTVAMRYMGLSFMPAVGIGVATSAMVGKNIGAGRPDLARHHTHVALAVAMTYMGLCGLAFWLFRYPMVELLVAAPKDMPPDQAAAMKDQIIRIGVDIMILSALFQLFDAVGIIFIGALRGAGDTFWPMVLTIALSWGVIVGGGTAVAYMAPQWTSVGPWLAASSYVVVLGVVMAWRFESGAWRKINLLGKLAGEPTPEPLADRAPIRTAIISQTLPELPTDDGPQGPPRP